MKLARLRFLLLILPILLNDNTLPDKAPFLGECTIGVFSGRATTDGRPLLWKNRDITNAVQKFCYYGRIAGMSDTTMAYIGNTYSDDTTRVFMGLNEAGFAVMNSNTYNLDDVLADGVDDGVMMRMALEHCRTIADFEHILDMTSISGRRDCWNFGAIDAYGHAAMYECANRSYVKYDANDSLNEASGVVLRATFSLSGGDSLDGLSRYKRATHLLTERIRHRQVDVPFILQTMCRDLANPIADPYPLPYDGSQNGRPAGFILAKDVTINRTVTRSVMVMRGVRPGEDPKLATIYAIIGPPVLSVAYPLWVESHAVPSVLNSGYYVPMYSQVNRRIPKMYSLRNDGDYLDSRYLVGKDGDGMFAHTFPLETYALAKTESLLTLWRHEVPGREAFQAAQGTLADTIYSTYFRIPLEFSPTLAEEVGSQPVITNYPNPFNTATTIDLSSFGTAEPVKITIFNLLGQEVRKIESAGGRNGSVVWDGRDNSNNGLASGVYLVNATNSNRSATIKVLMMK